MPKAAAYSGKYTSKAMPQSTTVRAASTVPAVRSAAAVAVQRPAPAKAVVVPKPARREAKLGPLMLIGCLVLALLSVLVVPMVARGAAPAGSKAQSQAAPVDAVSYSTLQDALAALGITPAVPGQLPEGFQVTACRAVNGNMLEMVFTSGKTELVFRAAAGSDDLSFANHEDYAYTANETVNGITRGYVGVSDKKLNLAVWGDGEYSYALVAEGGVDAAVMRQIAECIA